jgi:hypothetical protein
VTSWLWPSANLIPIAGPSVLVRALIVVENRRERPSALRADDGRIDHLQNRVGHSASNERFQDHIRDAAPPHRN